MDNHMKDMLHTYIRWRRLRIAPYGGSLQRWPALMVDAMDLFRTEHIRFENAEAEARKMEN